MTADLAGNLGQKQKSWNPGNFRILVETRGDLTGMAAEIDGSLGQKQKPWNPGNFRILAETRGDLTGTATEIGETAFQGAGVLAVDVTVKPRNIPY